MTGGSFDDADLEVDALLLRHRDLRVNLAGPCDDPQTANDLGLGSNAVCARVTPRAASAIVSAVPVRWGSVGARADV
jgi:hypothetical protein